MLTMADSRNIQYDNEPPLQFIIKLTTPFQKVFNAFCDKHNVALGTFRAL
jgi:hypothetical protein